MKRGGVIYSAAYSAFLSVEAVGRLPNARERVEASWFLLDVASKRGSRAKSTSTHIHTGFNFFTGFDFAGRVAAARRRCNLQRPRVIS